jgi:hypothetical protein
MRPLLAALMLGNAALFVFGALQHAGVAIGSLCEPVIISASVVELLCALALANAAQRTRSSNLSRSQYSSKLGRDPGQRRS